MNDYFIQRFENGHLELVSVKEQVATNAENIVVIQSDISKLTSKQSIIIERQEKQLTY